MWNNCMIFFFMLQRTDIKITDKLKSGVIENCLMFNFF